MTTVWTKLGTNVSSSSDPTKEPFDPSSIDEKTELHTHVLLDTVATDDWPVYATHPE